MTVSSGTDATLRSLGASSLGEMAKPGLSFEDLRVDTNGMVPIGTEAVSHAVVTADSCNGGCGSNKCP